MHLGDAAAWLCCLTPCCLILLACRLARCNESILYSGNSADADVEPANHSL